MKNVLTDQSSERLLQGEELLNFMDCNGILQEINRTFLHPLGIELRPNYEKNEFEFYTSDDPKGYLLDKISQMKRQAFQKFNLRRQTERNKLLGFGIQTQDLFRSENMTKLAGLVLAPDRVKIEAITACFNIFCHIVYSKIMSKHKKYDSNFDPEQFSKDELLENLRKNLRDEDWVDVAALAMMFNQKDELQKSMVKCLEYRDKYYENQKKLEESKKGIK